MVFVPCHMILASTANDPCVIPPHYHLQRKLVFGDLGKMFLAWFLIEKNILRENILSNIDIKIVPRKVRRVPRIGTFWVARKTDIVRVTE